MKFVSRPYPHHVHECLAKEGYAPKLLGYQEFDKLWNVVVMEYIENGKHFDKNEHKDLISALEKAVKKMHAQDYVHGDLRTPNILVKDKKLFIVDFDWASNLAPFSK